VTTPSVPATPENPLEHPAVVAHGFLAKIETVVAEAKAEIEKFLPASAVDAIEETGIKDAEAALKQTTGL
jgi:hypothetical protein